ncbi:uncharacterized protein LOC117026731 [Rhinolophus ferrumequinum]|uniref:uncharacterized protein LOC117026731 n=1 Tax=Rhinolophus ferrumequinum TaxID=59479 RepID=UPI00140FE845|nr:uncharacterized protein LOC117026731 [Rhinolophus ferrumequinum]
MEPQASCELTEGCERVAPSVPNHGEHTVSRRKRSVVQGSQNKGSSGLQAISAMPPPGNDAKTAQGQGHLGASVPFTPTLTRASLHCHTSVYPPPWSTECLGRHPIFGAHLTPHTHGHQVPPVRSHDGSFRRRGPHRAVWSVTLGSSRARHPQVAGPCSGPTLLLLQAGEEPESSPGVPLGPCPAASPPACPCHTRQAADIPGSRDRPRVTAQVLTSLKEQGREVAANTKQYGRLCDQNVARPLVTTSLTPTF